MQRVVAAAVVIFLAQPLTNVKAVVRADGGVAEVEEFVQVGAEEEAVVDGVRGLKKNGAPCGMALNCWLPWDCQKLTSPSWSRDET